MLTTSSSRNWGLFLLSTGLAIGTTWPLARFATTHLPLGSEPYATVPLFNVWTIWWNADRLAHGLSGYWQAPIFHPATGTFAFSEPQPATWIVAPVIWITGSRVLAYNLYLWLALMLNALFAWRLLRVAGCAQTVSLAGAGAMLLLPIVHWQREVLQLVPVWPALWAWTALLLIMRRPTIVRGANLGAAVTVSFLTCVHQALLLAILLVGGAITLWRRWRHAPTWLALACALVVTALGTAPLLWSMQARLDRPEFERSRDLVRQLSARPGDYTAAPGKPLINVRTRFARPHWSLSPGWIKWALAAVGIVWGTFRRRWRWWTVFLLVTALLAFALSLGANLKIGAWEPYWRFAEVVPGLDRLRNVFRFAFFVQMAAVFLAALGLHALQVTGRRLRWRPARRVLCWGCVPLLSAAAALEVLPAHVTLGRAPDAAAYRGWITYVRDYTPPGRAVACLPMANGNNAADFELTTRWMYLSTFHGAPLVNGYSGFFPQSDFNLRDVVNASFPSEESLELLHMSGAELVVVLRAPEGIGPVTTGQYGRYRLELAYSDPAGVDVYRLTR